MTKRQEEILVFLANETSKNLIQPTIREVGNKFGITSTNGVSDHYRALQRKGYIVLAEFKSRGVQITEDGWTYAEVVNMFGSMA